MLAEARAVLREPARRQDQGGNWRPSHLFLPHPSRPRTAPPSESDDSESTPRVRQRPGGAMLYASRLHTLMHIFAKAKGGPQPLAAGRTSAGSGTRQRGGHGPSRGGPSDVGLTPRLGDRPTPSSDQRGQRLGNRPGLSPPGGPGWSRGRTHLQRPGWQRASSGSIRSSGARARAGGMITGSGVSG